MLTGNRSYCDTRYKIAGQWYGIPKIMAKSQTLKTEVVDSQPDRIIFKLQQEYTPRLVHFSKPVNSLVTLTLDDQGKVKYHKDMWNEKDYSHEGLGKVMKTLNGDHLTKVSACSTSKGERMLIQFIDHPTTRDFVDVLHENHESMTTLEISTLKSIHTSSSSQSFSALDLPIIAISDDRDSSQLLVLWIYQFER